MLTIEDTKKLLRKPENDYALPEDRATLIVRGQGNADTLGKKILLSKDLDGVRRVGQEEVLELTNGTIKAGALNNARRVGMEVETQVNGSIGNTCKENPDDDVTVGKHKQYRDDTSKMRLTKGIEIENTNFLDKPKSSE